MTVTHVTTEMRRYAVYANIMTIALMYKRSIKPIIEFLRLPPPCGVYIIDTQFGKINYVSGEISPVISTRIDANSAYYVIEIHEEENIRTFKDKG